MSRPYTPKVVTANALVEGDVVYLTADDRWSRDHAEAEMIEDEAHGQLRLIHATRQQATVVGAYLAEARHGPMGPEPVHFREVFRSRGPSNHAHGKQETGHQATGHQETGHQETGHQETGNV